MAGFCSDSASATKSDTIVDPFPIPTLGQGACCLARQRPSKTSGTLSNQVGSGLQIPTAAEPGNE
jgi:hypothetical protein